MYKECVNFETFNNDVDVLQTISTDALQKQCSDPDKMR